MATTTKAAVTKPVAFHVEPFITSYMKAWNDHDVDGLLAHLTDDVIWITPDLSEPLTGKEQVRAYVTAMFTAFPDLHQPLEDVEIYTAKSGHAAARWTMLATMTGPMNPPGFAPTGKSVRMAGVCLYEFRDGLFSKHTIVTDNLGFLQQLGILPSGEALGMKALVGLQWITAKVTHLIKR